MKSNRKPKRRVRKQDPDIAIVRGCARLLDKSTSPRMARANLEFLYGCYVHKLETLGEAMTAAMEGSSN